ncbi:MAG TPA: hypothetical protein VM939_08325 [Gemmatimonadaceae bacterium]|nr:hypothetical protein [Gemmatimonadaceae bacterium]
MVIRLIILAALAHSTATAQVPALSATANEAWNKRDWTEVAKAYEAIARVDTTTPLPHIRLGVALTALGRYAEAAAHIKSAEKLGASVPQVAFRRALVEAGLGKLDNAFTELKRATDAGLGLIPNPGDSTPQMEKIRKDPRYKQFATAMDRNARPCMHDAKYSEFDFWLGAWEARPRGQPHAPAGQSLITKIDQGCVVFESWKATGSEGQSFNIYDRTRSKWFQIWVDASGGLHEYSGIYKDNAMRYEGETPAPPPSNGRVKTRLTFFRIAPDTVRQFSERLQPDGTWAVNYDLIYTRAKPNG